MARGAPDYSNVKSGEDLHRLDDLAELPPRFGLPSSIDRAGEVVVLEDFRYGLIAVETNDAGKGGSVTVSNKLSRFGGFTAKLARAANTLSVTSVGCYTPSLESGKIGAEIQFNVESYDAVIQLWIGQYTGTQRLLWGLKWSGLTDQVYIGGETVGWESVATGIDTKQDIPIFHNMKLVCDVGNEDYERVFINGVLMTLVAKDAYIINSTSPPHVTVTVENYGGTANANELYLDYIIITRNEP